MTLLLAAQTLALMLGIAGAAVGVAVQDWLRTPASVDDYPDALVRAQE